MSEPIKDNAHILSNQQAFQEAYTRARVLFEQIDGVVSVGFGLKQTGGQFRDDIVIVVFVREKRKPEELSPGQLIPESFEGYKTDVRTVPETQPGACDNTAVSSTIQGGIQIVSGIDAATGQFDDGTLGCIVRKRNDSGRENVYLLSNKHVLFMHGAREGDYVYHPFPPNPARSRFADPGPSNALGPIQPIAFYSDVSYTPPGGTSDNFFIDCAFARIDIDRKCCGNTCTKDVIHYGESIIDLQLNGVNTISDVRSVIGDVLILNKKVFKVGRTTGKTQGLVVSTTVTVNTNDPTVAGNPAVVAHNNIEIIFDVSSTPNGLNCKGLARFADHGDSGSMVLDEQSRVIGIISQVSPPGAPSNSSAIACHIVPILDRLNICIPTTPGTSHGSSRATDGSGIAPASAVLGDFEIPDGAIVFTAQPVTAMPARSPGFPEPVLVTDDEVRHMRELLDAFRNTRKGRELHDLFAEVRREIGYLVRNCRPVKVAWHRNKGPAFLAHVLNHLKGDIDRVPREVDGVSAVTLLTRMSEVLGKYGSNPLRRAIEQHGDDLLLMLTSGGCNSVQDCIAYLQQRESA